ncbi:hypothetical protein ACWDG9_43070 [Streptomyces sp. NPDC001073]
MTHRTDIGRLVALLEPLRVLDAFCCIGGATTVYRRAFLAARTPALEVGA